MGWNSWDFYGTSINEERTKAQADYMAANLLSHGWNLITVDIQWYQPTATGFGYINGATLTTDSYSRLTPATNRFPSAANAAGFKPLADYVHSKGLKFGIHMMRGIPRQAVTQKTPIFGTSYTADQIADTSSTCPWNPDMYGVNMSKPGAQEYYDSIMALVASWEVDFVKVDDLSRPYHTAEIEGLRKAIDKTGRAILLSTSPGETPVVMGPHILQQANQWRIADDFWDTWSALYAQFQRLHDWEPYRGAGYFPDADMLPLGKLSGGSNTATGRTTNFTSSEQYTLMSLWAIARSPLIHGGDMTQMDSATLALLTNDEVIAVNQQSLHNRQLFRTNDRIAWTADVEGSSDKYLALFNATSSSVSVPVTLATMGFTGTSSVRSLWDKTDLGTFSGTFSPTLASHRGALYRISGPSTPVPWISGIVAGSNRVAISWEAINSASSYSVKRATSETGTYSTITTGVAGVSYTDFTAQNGSTYFYCVSATINGQETPNSGAFSATAGAQGIVSWNFDRYGTVSATSVAGVEPVVNWSNSYPSNPTKNLTDNGGATTTLDIAYSSSSTWSIQSSHPGADANGRYDRELLNGFLNSGSATNPTSSSVTVSQIPFSSYDIYVYFSSDTANRNGTVTDGSTTFSFKTIGAPSISGSNAVLTKTTAASGNPAANYAVFTALTGSSKTITCSIPLNGGIAAVQIVPRVSPLAITSASTLTNGVVGSAYSQTLSGTGGYPPYTWALNSGTLPAGLSLSDTGVLSGTPTATGTFTLITQITDSSASGSIATLSLMILSQFAGWQTSNFTSSELADLAISGPVADPDGDGMTNEQEFAAGTNPKDLNSVLKISEMHPSGSNMLVSFPTVSGKTYRLEWTATLQSDSWAAVQDYIAGTGGTVQITDPSGALQAKRFYRVVVEQ